jgi:hypothetical protein
MPRGGIFEASNAAGGKLIGYSPSHNRNYVLTVNASGDIVAAYDNTTDLLLTGANIPTDLSFGSEPDSWSTSTRWVTVTDPASAEFGKTFSVLESMTVVGATYKHATGADKGKIYTPPVSGVVIDIEPVELTVASRSLGGGNAIAVGTAFAGISSFPANGQGCIVEIGTDGVSPLIGLTVRNVNLTVSNPLLPPILPPITKATYVKTNLSDNPMPVGTVFNLASRTDALAIQFRQLSDIELNALLIGSSPDQILPQSTAIPFVPIQTTILAGVTLPAVGAQVTATVAPIQGTPTNVAFIAGDVVILTGVKTDFGTDRIAWFSVDSVAGDAITMTMLARVGSSAAGVVFAAGSTEITGQTRLQIPSPLLSVARIRITANYQHITDALDSASTGYKVAKFLFDGTLPMAYYSIKNMGVPDIDMSARMGIELLKGGTIKLENRTDLQNFRLVSASPLVYLPALEIVYS